MLKLNSLITENTTDTSEFFFLHSLKAFPPSAWVFCRPKVQTRTPVLSVPPLLMGLSPLPSTEALEH